MLEMVRLFASFGSSASCGGVYDRVRRFTQADPCRGGLYPRVTHRRTGGSEGGGAPYFCFISPLSRGYLTAISRLSHGHRTAISRLSHGYLSFISRLSCGYPAAIPFISLFISLAKSKRPQKCPSAAARSRSHAPLCPSPRSDRRRPVFQVCDFPLASVVKFLDKRSLVIAAR